MSADLLGYLVKGPRNLDVNKLADAIALVKARQVEIRAALKKMGLDDTEEPEAIAGRVAVTMEVDDLLQDLLPEFERGLDESDLLAMADQEAEVLVDGLYAFWESGSRDSASRLDPDDENVALVFAGEMSWGDEPGGSGYETLRDTGRFPGLHDLLGIR